MWGRVPGPTGDQRRQVGQSGVARVLTARGHAATALVWLSFGHVFHGHGMRTSALRGELRSCCTAIKQRRGGDEKRAAGRGHTAGWKGGARRDEQVRGGDRQERVESCARTGRRSPRFLAAPQARPATVVRSETGCPQTAHWRRLV
jgi:hypothetical protein